MSKEKARLHYLGQQGHKRLNCAQAIMHVFKEKFSLSDKEIASFGAWGGGRAPGGYCGAFYAAKVVLEKSRPEKLRECENIFLAQAGSTKCKDIKSSRKMSCVDCVEIIAESLERA